MELFGNNKKLKEELKDCEGRNEGLSASLRQERLDNKLELEEIVNNHKFDLMEKEFELKHFKDEEIKAAKKEVVEISKDLAVLRKENEMLKSITDVNADIIDVKDLMNKLVEKLPSIDLKSLTIQNTSKE